MIDFFFLFLLQMLPKSMPDTKVDLRARPKDIVVVHFPCPDGAAVQYLLTQFYDVSNSPTFIHYSHGTQLRPEEFSGKHVAFVDYMPPVALLQSILKVSRSVDVIDHHDSAYHMWESAEKKTKTSDPKLNVWIDRSQCAAVMIWRLVYGMAEPLPQWLKLIQEGDTDGHYRWDIYRRACHRALTHNLESKAFSAATQKDLDTLLKEGRVILDPILNAVRQDLKQCKRYSYSYEHPVTKKNISVLQLVVGAQPENISLYLSLLTHPSSFMDGGENLTEIHMFIFQYYLSATDALHRLSLRSNPAQDKDLQIDVSQIATRLSGGGHRAAAGVTFPTSSEFPYGRVFVLPTL
jgi:nanoRNase/pAp phosphatase (c-di-AMP/oligoRNAs hydrolase)